MTNSNQKARFQTKIAMLEQNNQVLLNKCDEYLGELERTKKALEFITRIYGAGMSYQDMFIDAQEVAKFALGQIKYPVLTGRYDKETPDLLKGCNNE